MKTVLNGILLHKLDYSETSLILHFFTLEQGAQAFIFQGGKRKNKKGNLLQPLSMIEVMAYTRPDSDLGKISEIASRFIPQSIPFHPLKSSMAFFMAEVLYQVLKSSSRDEEMFYFVEQEIKWLDLSDELTNYPIWFLFNIAQKFGIGINLVESKGQIFDLQEGTISNQTPQGHLFIEGEVVYEIAKLSKSNKELFLANKISKSLRTEILEHLLQYFRLHIDGFKIPKSLEVLRTIFA